METVAQIIIAIAQRLAQRHPHDIVARQQDAWWMLEAITHKTEAQLLAHKDFKLSDKEAAELDKWIDMHVNHAAPIQYLIGWVPFDEVKILTRPPVLIPRPETEEWVINLIEQLEKVTTPLTILDIGAGTGCIAIALAHALPHAQVYAADISQESLKLAAENIRYNQIKNVTLVASDLFAQLPKMKFDLIVSNPPYIAPSEWQTLAPSVTQWEDKRALLADDEGLAIIGAIAEQAPGWLRDTVPNNLPQVVIEFGYRQGPAVQKLFSEAGYRAVEIRQDLEGKDRVVYARV